MCVYTTQKAFHADVSLVMRRWLKQEEPFPEAQRPTTQAKEHYLNVRLLFTACRGLRWLLINRTWSQALVSWCECRGEVLPTVSPDPLFSTNKKWIEDESNKYNYFRFVNWPVFCMFHSWWSRSSLGSMETIWKFGTHCPKNTQGEGCRNKVSRVPLPGLIILNQESF